MSPHGEGGPPCPPTLGCRPCLLALRTGLCLAHLGCMCSWSYLLNWCMRGAVPTHIRGGWRLSLSPVLPQASLCLGFYQARPFLDATAMSSHLTSAFLCPAGLPLCSPVPGTLVPLSPPRPRETLIPSHPEHVPTFVQVTPLSPGGALSMWGSVRGRTPPGARREDSVVSMWDHGLRCTLCAEYVSAPSTVVSALSLV